MPTHPSLHPTGRPCQKTFFTRSPIRLCFGVLCCEGQLLRKSAVEGDIEDGEYLGAAMRLTAELSRYAITQVTKADEYVDASTFQENVT